MASTQDLSLSERVRFAVRHWPPTDRMVALIVARMPQRVMLLTKGRQGTHAVQDLDPREFGKLVRTIVGEMNAEGVEY